MRIIQRSDKADDMCFCYDHWRYCEWCGRCHKENSNQCRRQDEDWRKEEYKMKKMRVIDDRYERYSPDDEYERRYMDRYEKDDRHDMDNRRKIRDRYAEDDGYEENGRYEREQPQKWCKPEKQKHVHEFQGSVKLAEFDEDVHNHRFAGVSGEAIKVPGGHIHKIFTRTDFFDHFHFINKFTGLAIPVDIDKENGKKVVEKHVHFVEGLTTENDGHMHQFEVATLIESPLLPEEDEDIR